MKTLLTLVLLTLCAFTYQEATVPAGQLEPCVLLEQLVGEWKVTAEADLVTGHETVTWESEESVRSIGGLWVVAENTMQTTMWTYVGHLDESGTKLTLEAEGPSMHDPNESAKYRDVIEIVSPDHRRMVSSTMADDGSWTTFMTVDAHRVK